MKMIVGVAPCAYPIYIDHAAVNSPELWKKLIIGSQICIVTNKTIAKFYLENFKQSFANYLCSTVILPDGEIYKTLESWMKILDVLMKDKHKRNTTLIALGGGVIGDMTGFAAACYQRGVNVIQVPTTLLAQIDAAIGGKTGVNYQQIKNVVGAFYQPHAVVIDTQFLTTLPEREFRAGLAEVIKYALIHDAEFFDYLSLHVETILNRDNTILNYIVETCCRIKTFYIEKDELDKTGQRALLNFGHTFGHALETVSQYQFLHGEAVAWGMRNACQLSQRLGYLSLEDLKKIENLLNAFGLLIQLPATITINALLEVMHHDKKKSTNQITFILLNRLGKAFVTNLVNPEILEDVMRKNIC